MILIHLFFEFVLALVALIFIYDRWIVSYHRRAARRMGCGYDSKRNEYVPRAHQVQCTGHIQRALAEDQSQQRERPPLLPRRR